MANAAIGKPPARDKILTQVGGFVRAGASHACIPIAGDLPGDGAMRKTFTTRGCRTRLAQTIVK
jgi:hypothetical protein